MKKVFYTLLVLFYSTSSQADNFEDHFAFVFIDEVTESKYGPVPLKRSVLAKAITEIAGAGAKGVVLKFFLDQPKDETADRLLAQALNQLPVILQARIDKHESSPNRLPDRFTLPFRTVTAIEGNSGWIPSPRFSAVAHDIAFIDFTGFPVPLLETYQGRTVKSLFLSAIELAYGESATIEPFHQAKIGRLTLDLDSSNQVSVALGNFVELPFIPFHDVLEKNDWLEQVRNKVVIIGYDGPRIHSIDTPAGSLPAHRLFIQVLKVLVENGN